MAKKDNEKKQEKICSTSMCPLCLGCKYIWNIKKRYKILLAFILLLIGGVYFALNTDWQSIVRSLVHKYGSQVVGTSVDIGKIDLSLLDGKGAVSNITVANPKGYSSDYIIKLGNVSVNVDINSITKNTIIIKEIRVDKPEITYEMLTLKQNNVNDILANIQKNTASKPSETTDAEPKEKSTGKQVAIKKVVIADGVVSVVSNMLGSSQSMSVNLPTVTINDIGSEKQGVTIEDGIARVFKEILNSTKNIVASIDISKIAGSVNDLANNAVEGASDAVKGAGKAVGDATKGVSDSVKNLTDGVGGLFK